MARKVLSSYAVFQNLNGSSDVVFYYESGGADTVTGVSPAEAGYIVDLLRHEKPVSYDHDRKRLSTWTPEPVGEAEQEPDLDAWLTANGSVAASIIWEDAAGAQPWTAWDASRKTQLREAFQLARHRGTIAVADVPENRLTLTDDESAKTILSQADAWAYYKASVAQSLAVEIDRQVSWSVTGYSAAQLAQLFDSRALFRWHSAAPAGYQLKSGLGHILPAPPVKNYEFLGVQGLIGFTRLETIIRVLDWCRANLIHYEGSFTAANVEDQWQYRGYPPMTRVLAGTKRLSQPNGPVKNRTAGCWGTTGLLRTLLRVVNIPVKLVKPGGHAQPWFMADSQYLSHGDDPYNQLTKATPPIPAGELLIDQTKYDAWFGDAVSADDRGNNVGRRTRELALIYLPNYLLRAYCDDIAAGKSHANGKVFEIFSRHYTVAQLEGLTLWTRMDAKIAGFGGCSGVPT
ncbi:hypothetical protein GCM10023189_49120 [Nibrella saemangeumensis]|uniref:Uncharacterized protein n=1 Tax=Nibrella saemangeumensis TaxID=1084526 RepID=A0ABP8NIX6_9BACT